MARLATVGFESRDLGTGLNNAESTLAESISTINVAGVTAETTVVRSGTASAKYTTAPAYSSHALQAPVLARAYFARTYFRFPSVAPASQVEIFAWRTTAHVATIRLNTDGTLTAHDNAGTQVGAASPALRADQWYCVETKIIIPAAGNGTFEFRIDGQVVASSAAVAVGTVVTNFTARVGQPNAGPAGFICYCDDFAFNDDQGASQNSYPGEGKIVVLRPISDNAIGTFTGGAGGTTNLWDALNATPPAGVVLASATNTSQIKSVANNATDTYTANCAKYTDTVASGGGGMAPGDKVTVAKVVGKGGNSTTTSRSMAILGVGNPAITEAARNTGTTAAGTEPTGWTPLQTLPSYDPVIVPATTPTIRFRKGTASVDALMFDYLGLLVEYRPTKGPTARRVVASSPTPPGGSYAR